MMVKSFIKADFHCHFLPGIDDGSSSAEMSCEMLRLLSAQGVKKVAATPHFYLHNESVESFLSNRDGALETLENHLKGQNSEFPDILTGAEVCIEHEMSLTSGLDRLCIGDTGYILLEIPFTGYSDWMAEEIFNICCKNRIKPILAHLERYFHSLSENQLGDLLSLDDVVVQINAVAFDMRSTAKFALGLIKSGLPVVFGSDAHNLLSRSPDLSRANKFLLSKLKADGAEQLTEAQLEFINGSCAADGLAIY